MLLVLVTILCYTPSMTTNNNQTNSTRFINAYNEIDHALRIQYNFKTNISFTDLIRRCASLNAVIKNHEDDLISFARLRNAIVHSVGEHIVAEPHLEVVELMEKIARIVTTPPLALDTLKMREVATVQSNLSLRQWLVEKCRFGYSNLPVYKGNALIGVMNWRHYVDAMAKVLVENRSVDQFNDNTTVEEFLRDYVIGERYFNIVSSQVTIEEILKMFNNNRKLTCVIITKTGNYLESPLGIITGADVMDLMKILEDF